MAERLFGTLRTGRRIGELILAFVVFSIADASALGQPAGGGQQGSALGMFVPLLLMFLVLYLFMIRPAQKRQKEKERMLSALKKGDRIITSGGIYGEIQQVKDNVVVVRIADNVKIELQRSAVASVVEQGSGE